jgi:hypothetical protein
MGSSRTYIIWRRFIEHGVRSTGTWHEKEDEYVLSETKYDDGTRRRQRALVRLRVLDRTSPSSSSCHVPVPTNPVLVLG